ncbi:MAG TPA: SAM-dependent methyltransferase [Opitutaceae bacterium]|nr:SAM-dependent methyltransferase [Opitutaceae bacterium]
MTKIPSASFLAVFRAQADAHGAMPFDRFMELALYDPAVGYYRREQSRVGYEAGTDFFTASTSGPVFGELVAAAGAALVRAHGGTPGDFVFVEIGAEPATGVLAGVTHPFGAVRPVRVGEPIELSGHCIVFSNELFDAQPCRRFVRRAGVWRELGVAECDGRLVEIELGAIAEAWLPAQAPEGYCFDAPRAAADLAARIAAQPWSGLFLAFDYGKSWPVLAEETPAGTARAYHRHTQSNDLLARPGEQDLTCHVCWDWLRDALVQGGFAAPQLESQEAFFVRHAAEYLAAMTAAEGARFSPKKLSLLQLLHPAHLGQKFQALHAWRG